MLVAQATAFIVAQLCNNKMSVSVCVCKMSVSVPCLFQLPSAATRVQHCTGDSGENGAQMRPQRKNDPAMRCLWFHCYRHSSLNAADTGRIVHQQIYIAASWWLFSRWFFQFISGDVWFQESVILLLLLLLFLVGCFSHFWDRFSFTQSKEAKPIGKQTNKRKLPKLASPALRSICPWPTFLSLPLAWEVFTGSRRKASVLALRTAEAALKVRRMCIVKCPTIKGEHPLKLAWRVTT